MQEVIPGVFHWTAPHPRIHHYRASGRFAERFGCSAHCNRAGLHEFCGGRTAFEM
jgi:hypothetical protein